MASAYPGALDTFATDKDDSTTAATDHPAHHNDLADAVNKIEAELGVNPSGPLSTVADYLTAIGGALGPLQPLLYPYTHVQGETGHADDDFFATVTGYTEVDVSGTTVWSAGRGGLSCVFGGQSGNNFGVLVKPIPAAGVPITIETRAFDTVLRAASPMWGIIFTDGTAAGSNLAAFGKVATGTQSDLYQFSGTVNSVSASLLSSTSPPHGELSDLYMRLCWSAANTFGWSISPDSENWTDFGQGDLSTTFTPTHMGFFVSSWGGSTGQIVNFHYLRVYEDDLSV